MANKITFGLRNVHIALREEDDSITGEPSWDDPVPVPGAVGFRPTPEGEEFTMYADDTIWFTATRNTGYSAELEIASMDDELLAAILNYTIDENDALIEDADALPVEFALMGEVDGDEAARRFVYYNCVATRPDREERTKEATISPNTDTLSLTITPVRYDAGDGEKYYVRAVMPKTEDNSGGSTDPWETFFDDVYLPDISV